MLPCLREIFLSYRAVANVRDQTDPSHDSGQVNRLTGRWEAVLHVRRACLDEAAASVVVKPFFAVLSRPADTRSDH
jgi:hypothetical protein